ncbi:MAG: SprT-like domain-containing protein [Thermoplasmata archaeon]|nr:SprT-like domain-containing protein [Thermoplasmata archaeon]
MQIIISDKSTILSSLLWNGFYDREGIKSEEDSEMIRYVFSNIKPLPKDKKILSTLRAVVPNVTGKFKGKGIRENFDIWIATERSWLKAHKPTSIAHASNDDRLKDRQGNYLSRRGKIGVISLRRKYLVSVLKLDKEKINDLLCHELIHFAIAADGHGREFKMMAKSIGLKGDNARATTILSKTEMNKMIEKNTVAKKDSKNYNKGQFLGTYKKPRTPHKKTEG